MNHELQSHPAAASPQTEPSWAGQRMISLPALDVRAGRGALLAYFENTWRLTETLFSALVSDEAYFLRPYHKTRHPPAWTR